ncbi:MAG TPA: ROK family protein [Candidatus Peribacteraceae bacterium]|nr:ROK family protein [Candidatus Peribacteraceae bacterium]
MASLVGVDLGGTHLRIARYDAGTLALQSDIQSETRAEQGFEAVLRECVVQIRGMCAADTIGVGVGIPGLIHQPDGIVIKTPNIPDSEGVHAKKILETELSLPVAVQNDANCFTLAEAVMGAGKGKHIVIGITMGTGVGGGIVVDGRLFNGSHGFAGEFGHMLLQPGKPPFKTSDSRGEVEQFISGTAMGRRCVEATHPGDYLDGEVCEWMRPDIFREVAWLCTSLLYVLDPDVIVFGGSAGASLKPHLPSVMEELKRWTLPDTPLPELAACMVKDAGTMGAALLVRAVK